MTTNNNNDRVINRNNSSNSSSNRLPAILVIAASSVLLATLLVIGTYTTTTPQIAYAQEEADEDDGSSVNQQIQQVTNPPNGDTKTLDIQSAENSENSAHRGVKSMSLTVEPGGEEEDDTPANHLEMTKNLPNDRLIFRIVESAPQSQEASGENFAFFSDDTADQRAG